MTTKLNPNFEELISMKCKFHPLEDLEYFIPFEGNNNNKNSNIKKEVLFCGDCIRENNELSDAIHLKKMMRRNKEELIRSTIYLFKESERKQIAHILQNEHVEQVLDLLDEFKKNIINAIENIQQQMKKNISLLSIKREEFVEKYNEALKYDEINSVLKQGGEECESNLKSILEKLQIDQVQSKKSIEQIITEFNEIEQRLSVERINTIQSATLKMVESIYQKLFGKSKKTLKEKKQCLQKLENQDNKDEFSGQVSSFLGKQVESKSELNQSISSPSIDLFSVSSNNNNLFVQDESNLFDPFSSYQYSKQISTEEKYINKFINPQKRVPILFLDSPQNREQNKEEKEDDNDNDEDDQQKSINSCTTLIKTLITSNANGCNKQFKIEIEKILKLCSPILETINIKEDPYDKVLMQSFQDLTQSQIKDLAQLARKMTELEKQYKPLSEITVGINIKFQPESFFVFQGLKENYQQLSIQTQLRKFPVLDLLTHSIQENILPSLNFNIIAGSEENMQRVGNEEINFIHELRAYTSSNLLPQKRYVFRIRFSPKNKHQLSYFGFGLVPEELKDQEISAFKLIYSTHQSENGFTKAIKGSILEFINQESSTEFELRVSIFENFLELSDVQRNNIVQIKNDEQLKSHTNFRFTIFCRQIESVLTISQAYHTISFT